MPECADDVAESKAMGQPLMVARRMILSPAALWKYYAGYAGKVAGESYPPDEDGTYKIVQYQPLGESFRTLVCCGLDGRLTRCRCMCGHLCMERFSRPGGLEDGTGDGGRQHVRAQAQREESVVAACIRRSPEQGK